MDHRRKSAYSEDVDGDGSQHDRDIDQFIGDGAMQIDGRTQAIALGVLSGLGFVAALSPSMFPSFIPPGIDADIAKSAGLVGGLIGAVGSGMGLFSSSRPGPLAPQDPPVVSAATALASAAPEDKHDAALVLHAAAMATAPAAYDAQGHVITGADAPLIPPAPGKALN